MGNALLVSTDSYGTLTSATFTILGTSGLFDGGGYDGLNVSLDSQAVQSFAGTATANSSGKWGPDFDPPSDVPEPASIFLMPAALFAFALRARKSATRA